MVEFFEIFNSCFWDAIDYIALVFPFALCLSVIISGIMLFVKIFRGKKNEKR